MTVRPIIFSGPMVRALLEGRKYQTRRLASSPLRKCAPGDLLYVRESGAWKQMREVAPEAGRMRGAVWYAADGHESGLQFFGGKKRPSIHMPRWASRLTLRVLSARLEPLQRISHEDAIAEGCPGELGPNPDFPDEWDPSPQEEYRELWESLHGAESWAEDPLVVVLTFTILHANIDSILAVAAAA